MFWSTKEPHVVVEMLNKMFTKFDSRAKELGLEKIKTHHQKKILLMGLAMVHCIQELNAEGLTSLPELNIQIRIGAATGTVQAGVIGMEKVCYDVFGHVAEESEHMEQSGLADRVQASPALREATRDMSTSTRWSGRTA
jgi:adenylate cyclase